jgi:transcriptional regulator with XRE-family HTH domain
MKVREHIKELMNDRNVSVQDLADYIETPVSSVKAMLTGDMVIEADKIPHIARKLKVPITSLFDCDEDLRTLED